MSTAQRERDELRRSIEEFSAGGYTVDRVGFSVCACGNETFAVVLDDEVAVAATICAVCEEEAALADSDDHFDDVEEVQQAECSCGNSEFRVASGFALDPDGEVRWVSVGLRCTADGVAGVYVDWKIDYRPTSHLLAQA
ncbi:hypothetical protein SK224_06440 [Microbacterium sp. BG28]|uniref:hypothetical protein n=1 Tax=Microbacterium sp. BG28 TaxID=3097356 RepID=UPI002A5A4F0B|nr:hypothetical protein [Microbacterium sp. BG28]MDY0828764.1 hypothetical protein [Microbacterium sp. BG28]